MTIIDAVLLGLVQGLTEFLPVSSTGHLILMREVLNLQMEVGLAVDAVLHFATALAVLIYFRKDMYELFQSAQKIVRREAVEKTQSMLLYAILLGSVPAVVAGLLFEEHIGSTFRDPHLVAYVLLAGSALFVFAEIVNKRLGNATALTLKKGFYIGVFQALALLPGMSRSGATISGGMLMGLTREKAARFSFLLSFPIIVGAGSKKILELFGVGFEGGEAVAILLSASVAFASGIACIHFLMQFLKNHTLYPFVVYRAGLALLVLFFLA